MAKNDQEAWLLTPKVHGAAQPAISTVPHRAPDMRTRMMHVWAQVALSPLVFVLLQAYLYASNCKRVSWPSLHHPHLPSAHEPA